MPKVLEKNGNTTICWINFIAFGFGYSGTRWFSDYLSLRGLGCTHERLPAEKGKLVFHTYNDRPQGDIAGHNYWTVTMRDNIPEWLRYVNLLRHPVNTLNSHLAADMAMDKPFMRRKYALLPEGDWKPKTMKTVSKIWYEQHRLTQKWLEGKESMTLKVEEMEGQFEELVTFLGGSIGALQKPDKAPRKNVHNRKNKVFGRWDDMVPEAQDLASEMGYGRDDKWSKAIYRIGDKDVTVGSEE